MSKSKLARSAYEKVMSDPAAKKQFLDAYKKKQLQKEYGSVSTPDMDIPAQQSFGDVKVIDDHPSLTGKLPPKPEPSMFDKGLDLIDRPGAAVRTGLHGMVTGKGLGEAKKAFTDPLGKSKPASGYDVASEIGEKFGIENPAILGTLATGVDLLDPTMVLGKIGKGAKAIKNIVKGARPAAKYEKLLKRAGMAAEEGPEYMKASLEALEKLPKEKLKELAPAYGAKSADDVLKIARKRMEIAENKFQGNLDIANKDILQQRRMATPEYKENMARRVEDVKAADQMEDMLNLDLAKKRWAAESQVADKSDPEAVRKMMEQLEKVKNAADDTIPN